MPEDTLGTQRSNFCHLVNLDVFTIQGFEEIVLFTLARGLVGFCCFSYLVMLTHFPLEKCPLHCPPPPHQLCLYCTICSRESRSLGSGHSTQRSSRFPLCTSVLLQMGPRWRHGCCHQKTCSRDHPPSRLSRKGRAVGYEGRTGEARGRLSQSDDRRPSPRISANSHSYSHLP